MSTATTDASLGDSISERQAEALVTMIETIQPMMALKPHLERLKAIVRYLETDDLEFDEKLSVELTHISLSSSSSTETVEEASKSEEETRYEDCISTPPTTEPVGESVAKTLVQPIIKPIIEHLVENASEPSVELVIDDSDAKADSTDGNKDNIKCNDTNTHDESNDENNDGNDNSVSLTELKSSLCVSRSNSQGSTATQRNESFYLSVSTSHSTGLVGESNKGEPPLSPTRRPNNENLSPNKPPTPMKSASPSKQSQHSKYDESQRPGNENISPHKLPLSPKKSALTKSPRLVSLKPERTSPNKLPLSPKNSALTKSPSLASLKLESRTVASPSQQSLNSKYRDPTQPLKNENLSPNKPSSPMTVTSTKLPTRASLKSPSQSVVVSPSQQSLNSKYQGLTLHPENKNLSLKKPPSPTNSFSMESPRIFSFKSPRQSVASPSQRSQQSQQSLGSKYLDSSRFLDDTVEQFNSDSSRMEAVTEVFETYSILSHILEFDGSLAARYKNYDLIEGYKYPHRRKRSQSRFKQRTGTNLLAFTNVKFYSLIAGPEGLNEWRDHARMELEARKQIARRVMTNSSRSRSENVSPSPLAKIISIVIRNDAIEFDYLLSKHLSSIQQGTSINNYENGSDIFGMALLEYVDGGEDNFGSGKMGTGAQSMGLPHGHPFLKCIKCWNVKEFYYTTLLAELAYNAVVYGAIDVIRVLSSRHNTLYSTSFGPKGEQNLLTELVAYACEEPCCLEEISQGIRTLMVNQRFNDEELHARQRGSVGNSLHIAAAKGDRELVDALLDIGLDPCIRCDERALMLDKPNDPGSGGKYDMDNLWHPEDWARIRGHQGVARLLIRRRKQLQQQRQVVRTVLSETTNGSTLQTVDHTELTDDFETITANDTFTAEYDSNSSCSSEYDSEYDSDDSAFEEGPTFDEDRTFGEDDSSEYNSE